VGRSQDSRDRANGSSILDARPANLKREQTKQRWAGHHVDRAEGRRPEWSCAHRLVGVACEGQADHLGLVFLHDGVPSRTRTWIGAISDGASARAARSVSRRSRESPR